MVRDPFGDVAAPDLQTVLDALDDPGCRDIVKALEGAMSAKEVSDRCDIPLTTTYRKLDLLGDALLVEERTEIRPDGHHTMRYRNDFEEVCVALDDDREFRVSISRPARTADERLAHLWTQVRRET